MNKITLCADDYAYNEAVTAGILRLIEQKRLQATSCMTASPLWPQHAKRLLPYVDAVEVGLHLDLTDQCRLYSLKQLLILSHCRLLKQATLEAIIEKQLDSFVAQMGRLPDFIDGHEHVHHFPVIRRALLAVVARRFDPAQAVWVRVSGNCFSQDCRAFKPFILGITGAWRLRKMLKARGITANPRFAGIYNFAPDSDYPACFESFLKIVQPEGLIMCHPGLAEPVEPTDPIRAARAREFTYLIEKAL